MGIVVEPHFEITPFTMDYYEAAMALWRRCEGVRLSLADSRASIERYLERNLGMSFVARSGSEIVGTVLAGHDGRRGYLHHLAVAPDHRRQGVGRALESRCLAALRVAGIEKCHLFIVRTNESGAAFWSSRGWAMRRDIDIMSKELRDER